MCALHTTRLTTPKRVTDSKHKRGSCTAPRSKPPRGARRTKWPCRPAFREARRRVSRGALSTRNIRRNQAVGSQGHEMHASHDGSHSGRSSDRGRAPDAVGPPRPPANSLHRKPQGPRPGRVGTRLAPDRAEQLEPRAAQRGSRRSAARLAATLAATCTAPKQCLPCNRLCAGHAKRRFEASSAEPAPRARRDRTADARALNNARRPATPKHSALVAIMDDPPNRGCDRAPPSDRGWHGAWRSGWHGAWRSGWHGAWRSGRHGAWRSG